MGTEVFRQLSSQPKYFDKRTQAGVRWLSAMLNQCGIGRKRNLGDGHAT